MSNAGELETAFASSAADHDQTMMVQLSPLTHENLPRVVALAAQYRLPVIYEFREFVEGGGLLSYGQVWRAVATARSRANLRSPSRSAVGGYAVSVKAEPIEET